MVLKAWELWNLLKNQHKSEQFDIVCIGALTIDYHINIAGEIGLGNAGGGALYSAFGANIWNKKAGIVSKIGPCYPAKWLNEIAKSGISIKGINYFDNAPVERVFGRYYEDGEREPFAPQEFLNENNYKISERFKEIIKPSKNIAEQVSPLPENLPESYRNSKSFHLAPMPLEFHLEWAKKISSFNKECLITVDPGPHYLNQVDLEKIKSLLIYTDVFLPSKKEIDSFLTEKKTVKKVEILLKNGLKNLIIKAGKEGAFIYSQFGKANVSIYPTEAQDLTGAGDSFCGGLLAGEIVENNLFKGAKYGSVSASFAIENFGALHLAEIKRKDAENRLINVDLIEY